MMTIKISRIYVIALTFMCLLSCVNNKPLVSSADENAAQTSKLSIVELLKEKKDLPIKEKVALYYKLKNENSGAYTFKDELQLTLYGYSFLWENKVDESMEIFKLIIAEFPNSSNAYDNLAEAYLKKGNKELALEYYGKALALNPENINAGDQVERIQFPGRVPEKPADKFAKTFASEKYKADLDQLGNTLLKIHPNALKFISREAFWKAIEMKKALITDNTTYGEFAWHCSE
ncbi:MAG: tetratricopeptide repeat protein, partial [Ginsengibacter sp.]